MMSTVLNQPERPPVMRLAAMLAASALAACAAPVPYPREWSPVLGNEPACAGPSGYFADTPTRSHTGDGTAAAGLPLRQVVFGDLLGGFAVTHLQFEPLPGGPVRVTPWVGPVALQETRILEPASRRCRADRWQLTAGWEGDGYSTATAAFITAGMLMPLAFKVDFTLHLNSDGELVVHAQQSSVNTVAIVIPFRTRDHYEWHAYARITPGNGSDAR